MKKIVLIVSSVLLLACTSHAALAPTSPSYGITVSSAGGPMVLQSAGKAPRKLNLPSGQPATITDTPILMPYITSPSWGAAADQAIADAQAGGLTTNTAISAPGSYVACDGAIAWQDLVYSTSTPMWNATLNPPAPFSGEDGPVVWQFHDARATSGQDELSLDMITVSAASSDGDILAGSVGFTTNSYSTRAIGIKADGSIITSGPASQTCVRVLVMTCTSLFNGGGTQGGLDSVKTWVNTHLPYSIIYTDEVGGDSSTASVATVSTSPPPPPFRLSLVNNGDGTGTLYMVNADPNASYSILQAPSLSGPWDSVRIIQGGGSVPVEFSDSGHMYEAVRQ